MSERNGWARTIAGMPKVGASAERTKQVTMRDIELFTEITGDRKPLHDDEALAKASTFGGLIVQGGVTSGLLNAAVAEDLPGPGTVFFRHGAEIQQSGGYVGDTITARVEIASVRADKPICTMNVSVRTHNGDTCLCGVATSSTTALRNL